jgi:hypothetical protein
LSGLLAEARDLDPDLPFLVALRVMYAIAPEIGVAVRQHDEVILLAVDDGTPLLDPQFGGSDVLFAVARLNTSARGIAPDYEHLRRDEVA